MLLCKNETGYRNLSYMVSMGFMEGFYIKPRIDMELLRAHSEGLIALSACLAGEIPRRFCATATTRAPRPHALEMRELFGEDSYYLELQDHGLPEQKKVSGGHPAHPRGDGHSPGGAPTTPTTSRREDAELQDVLMCIQMGKTRGRPRTA